MIYELTIAWRQPYTNDVQEVKARAEQGFTWEQKGEESTWEFLSEDGSWNAVYTGVVWFTEVLAQDVEPTVSEDDTGDEMKVL